MSNLNISLSRGYRAGRVLVYRNLFSAGFLCWPEFLCYRMRYLGRLLRTPSIGETFILIAILVVPAKRWDTGGYFGSCAAIIHNAKREVLQWHLRSSHPCH